MESVVRKGFRKLAPFLLEAEDAALNEADTVQRLVKVFEEAFGYNPFGEITREKQVKDKYVDLAIKVEGGIKFFIEAKAAGVKLRERHIEQAERYAAEGNIPWVLLTNGVQWQLYHLSFDEGIEYDVVVEADLRAQGADAVADALAVLHRDSVRKGGLDEFWREHSALSPETVIGALFHEDSLRVVRREIRRKMGLLVDEEDLADAIKRILSAEALAACGPVKIRRKRKARAPEEATVPVPVESPAAPVAPPGPTTP